MENKSLNLALPALFAVLSVFNTACSTDTVSSKDVSTEAIHQDYTMSYHEDSNTTEMSAQFRVGGWSGTTVELESPSSLKVNGQAPSKNSFLGTRYYSSSSGYVPTATFEFTTTDGSKLTNSISIDPLHLLKADQTVSVLRTYEADVDAPKLTSGETITVQIQQQISGKESVYATGIYDRSRSKASFSPSELNKLENGNASLVIYRAKTGSLAQATKEGGGIAAYYYLRPVSVNVVDKAVGIPNLSQR